MYQPISIKIKNVGSIKDLEYDFKLNKSQIIQGINLDNVGQRNNGVGKSSFIDAIGFSMTGLSLRNVNTEEFIRDDENEAYLEFLLRSKDEQRELLIKRFLYRKKAQQIEIYLNGEDKHKDLPDVNSRNDFIVNEIGISKEDLFQFFLITKDRYKPYFKLSDTDKKAITSRFSNSDIIDDVFQHIDIDVKGELKTKTDLEIKLSSVHTRINTYLNEIENLQNQIDPEYKAKLVKEYTEILNDKLIEKISTNLVIENELKDIDLIEISIETLTKQLFKEEYFQELDDRSEKLSLSLKNKESKFSESIKKFKDNIQKSESSIIIKKKELSEIDSAINDLKITFNKNENILRSSIECPSCQHEFTLSKDIDLNQIKKDQTFITETIKMINVDIVSIKDKIEIETTAIDKFNLEIASKNEEFEKSIKDIKDSLRLIDGEIESGNKFNKKINDDFVLYNRKIESIKLNTLKNENKIILLEEAIETIENKIKNVDTIDNKEAIERYKDLIAKSTSEIVELDALLIQSTNKLQDYQGWVLKFKSFKSYLANQSLKNVEDLINYYLDRMNTDISVEINSYSQKGKVIREKITETILRNGFPIGSYGRFSGGERGRIDMGSILANQTLINNNASPRGLDFILIDEILESLDSVGIEGIIKAMDNVDKTLILISQNEINTLQDQTITFIKENGQTKIQK